MLFCQGCGGYTERVRVASGDRTPGSSITRWDKAALIGLLNIHAEGLEGRFPQFVS